MQLQKFVGESMPVVLSTLKDALGSDAIILANRRVGDHIEIIATGSLDEASIDNAEVFNNVNEQAAAPAAALAAAPAPAATATPTTVEPFNPPRIEADGNPALAQNVTLSEPAVESPVEPPVEAPVVAQATAEPTVAVETSNAASAAVESEAAGEPEQSNEPAVELNAGAESEEQSADAQLDIASDVASNEVTITEAQSEAMADSVATQVNAEVEKRLERFHVTMDQRLSQLEANMWGEKDPVKSKLLQTFLEIGLGAELAVTLVNRVDGSLNYEKAMRQSLSDLANTLPIASDRSLTHDGITFVTGPSGSGKTTTLLKLAAHKMALAGPDSVVMICADAKRIGAFESLAAYGHSLGVSVVCASSQRELKELLEFYSNKELVLVDQPFENRIDELDIPEFALSEKDVVDVKDRSVRHLLVLPATIQSSVAEGVVSDYSKYPSARCVITNLDRPCRVGELFTTIIRHNLRVAYWSECADIQNPLNRASAQTLVAAAMAMGKRLVPSEDERYLMDLIHPRFSASVLPVLSASL